MSNFAEEATSTTETKHILPTRLKFNIYNEKFNGFKMNEIYILKHQQPTIIHKSHPFKFLI